MNRGAARRDVFCKTAALWVLVAMVSGPAGQNRGTHNAQPPFFVYLRTRNPSPALVAFSPTNHDPRSGAVHRTPSRESLTADLKSLRPAFDGLILYAYDEETTPFLLAEAERQGYRAVLLGVWDPKSPTELSGTIALVERHRNALALAVCIGNEGITANRYTMADLQKAADTFRARLEPASRVPVCTSEPVNAYGWAPLREFGDFLAPNIHPAWDRPKLDPRAAAAWARERAGALGNVARKPVLVKETGLPHGGDPRYTPEAQRAFWAAYVDAGPLALLSGRPDAWVSYAAAFEAFDLAWKAEASGLPIEGAWGLLSADDRVPYPALFVWKGLRRPL